MDKSLNYCALLTCALLFFALQSPALVANDLQDARTEADQYYQAQRYNESYKMYYKLAKLGDHYSQSQLATMYANGEGKSVDLAEAYAWSTLAAQSDDENLAQQSDELLLQVKDKARAEKKAAKLKKRYGDQALQEQADKRERIKRSHEMGGCTGARLGCSRG